MDDFLRDKLAGGTPLPEDMLGKILAQNDKRRRGVFFWLNLFCGLYLLVMGAALLNSNSGIVPVAHTAKVENTVSHNNSNADGNKISSGGQKDEDQIPQPQNETAAVHGHSAVQHIVKNNELPEIINELPGISEEGSVPVKKSEGVKGPDNEPIIIENPEPIHQPTIAEDPLPKDSQITVIAKVDSTTTPVTTATTPPKPKKFPIATTLFFNSGIARESTEFIGGPNSENRIHKDYLQVLNDGFQTRPSVQFNISVQLETKGFWFRPGFQYSSYTYNNKVNYRVKEVPVVLADGQIVGYLQLNDSFQYNVTSSFAPQEMRAVSLPLMAGYRFNYAAYSLNFGMGIAPEFRSSNEFLLFDPKYFTKLSKSEKMPLPTAPLLLHADLFRRLGSWSLGLSCNYIGPKKRDIPVNENIKLKYSRLEFGIQLGYTFSKKPKL